MHEGELTYKQQRNCKGDRIGHKEIICVIPHLHPPDRDSPCSPGCTGTLPVEQASWPQPHRDMPVAASRVLTLKLCTATTQPDDEQQD